MKNLEEENKKLKEMLEFKSDLISMMAHQLRTSLSAAKWVLKMFMDGDLGDINGEQKLFIKKAFDNNEEMIDLVSEIIKINKEESSSIVYNFVKEDLVPILEDIIDSFRGEAMEKKVKLLFEKESESICAHVDKEKIKTAVQGLIENAIKYSKEYGGEVLVSINKEGERHVKISVKDNGIGISETDHEKIFNKFFRTKEARKKDNMGSGLGLFAVKKIVERHSGKIDFESKLDEGTTFWITIPTSQ